jgi:LacI family transcriptional regulator
MKTQVTIKHIAAALGLSPSTVSRALKGHPDISESTKKTVRDLAKRWEYEPNALALSLRNQRSTLIGVMVPRIIHNFFSSVISGIEDVAHAAGYQIMVCQSNEGYDREREDINALVASRVAGILVAFSKETTDFDHFVKVQKRGIPMVFFDRICEEMYTSSVITDDFGGAFKATEHLIEQGCTRIAHLSGTDHLLISQNRLEGYMEALRKHNLPFLPELVSTCNTHSSEEGYQRTLRLLESENRPDGIFAYNDLAAVGAAKAVEAKGLRIPEDVAIVGYSDWLLATLTKPALSMVVQPSYEMGRVSAELLIKHIESGSEDAMTESRILDTSLVIRESSRRIAS